MILLLTPDQCSAYWHDLKQAVKIAMPSIGDNSDEGLNEVLSSLLTGTSQAWALLDATQVVAITITVIHQEPVSKARNLLIYALAGYANIKQELWLEGFNRLKAFATEMNCRKIIAYSSVPRVLDIAVGLGGNTNTHLLEWEI